jgi:hypothetical protein
MRWIAFILALAILEAGCAPTIEQQRSARLEALQLELATTLAAWKSDARLGHFGTSTNAARALVARYDLVYERWGLRADPLTQAMLAYAVALAVRVDRQEVSAEGANTLLDRMRMDLDRPRSRLHGGRAESTTERDAAMLACWKEFWAANHKAFEVTPRNPVRCEINPASGGGKPVVCY